jgi:hypothetical protein
MIKKLMEHLGLEEKIVNHINRFYGTQKKLKKLKQSMKYVNLNPMQSLRPQVKAEEMSKDSLSNSSVSANNSHKSDKKTNEGAKQQVT